MLKRLDLVLDSRKFVQEWPEKRQFLVKLRQIWNDFRHCAGSKSFFSSLLKIENGANMHDSSQSFLGEHVRSGVMALFWLILLLLGFQVLSSNGRSKHKLDVYNSYLKSDHFAIVWATCSIPEHCIDARRLALFIARSALRDLIAGLQADAKGVQAV